MSTQVEFLLLKSNEQWSATAIESLNKLYAQYERVLVVSENRQQLQQLDELLWHNSAKQFVPYSLDSECYSNSTSVLLTDAQPLKRRYNALLNIGAKMSQNPEQFRSIIELVSIDENDKEQARMHYKHYRHLGFQISHQQLD
ncbi:MAG: hypothetical protein DRQ47_05185 [Gammaproteobacteria bacterium]|nr:MAG: hypothetical protein DRQ47_05185 [Gammaproteobacteria bacterium]